MNDYIERKTSAEERRKQRFINKSSAVSIKYLRKIDELPHKPKALEPFMNILHHVFVDMQGAVKPENTPTVGTYCVMVPQELIYAAGAMPVKLCGGSYTAFNIGDDIAPRDVCPLVKAVILSSTVRSALRCLQAKGVDFMLAEALTAAISVGLGCGTCCGTSASSFLAVYILSEGGGFASSMKHVGGFFLGKVLSVCSITMISSALGSVFIDDNGFIGGFNLHHAMSWVMLASALYLIWKWYRERRKTCSKCGGKCSSKKLNRVIPSFTVGLAYGATPCAPLIMVAGYAITLSLPGALLLGLVFALASSLSPMLLIFGLSGALSGKIRVQLGKAMPWIQLTVYIAFLILAIVSLFWYN